MPVHRISIGFAQIACSRCDAIRILGVSCPDCGAQPADHEVDPNRQRRKRMAEKYRSALQEALDSPPVPNDPVLDRVHSLLNALVGWIESFLSAFAAASQEQHREAELIATATSFRYLSDEVEGLPTIRPFATIAKRVAQVKNQLGSAANDYISILEADTPLVAQRLAASFNSELESATAILTPLGDLISKWIAIDSSSARFEDLLLDAASEVISGEPGNDLMSADRAGRSEIDFDMPAPTGAGLSLLLVRSRFELIGKPDEFMAVFYECGRRLSLAPRLQQVLSSPNLVDDLVAASRDSEQISVASQAMHSAARTDRESLRAALHACHAFIEGPIHTLVAVLVSATTSQRGYEARRSDDTGALINTLSQISPSLAVRLHAEFRHAYGHSDWDIEGANLVLNARGARGQQPIRVPLTDFLDRYIELLETASAGLLAVRIIAEANGTSVPFAAEFAALQVSGQQQAQLQLVLNGFRIESVIASDHSLTIHTEGKSRRLARAGFMAAAFLGRETDILDVVNREDEEIQLLHCPTELISEFRNQNLEEDRTLALLVAGTSITLNGEPAVSTGFARKWLASNAIRLVPETSSGRQIIRKYRSAARLISDEELVTRLGRLMTHMSLMPSGLVPNREWRENFAALTRWSQAAEETPPWWSLG